MTTARSSGDGSMNATRSIASPSRRVTRSTDSIWIGLPPTVPSSTTSMKTTSPLAAQPRTQP